MSIILNAFTCKKLTQVIANVALATSVFSFLSADEGAPASKANAVVREAIEEDPSELETWSFEIDGGYSFAAPSEVKLGSRKLGQIEQHSNNLKVVANKELTEGVYFRVGGNWDRNSFGLPRGTPLPNTLQATTAIVGVDFAVADNWIVRIEAEPGIYSDFHDVTGEDVNVPVVLGASYLVNKDLQWVFGLRMDLWSSMPVVPGVGVRWQFADDWVLNFILPKPRVEYSPTQDVTLFVGADMKGGTFRVRDDIGSSVGNTRLNNAIVEYRDIRVGGGVNYEISPALSIEVEGGYIVDRRFHYERADTLVDTEGSPYTQLGIKAKF